MKKKKFKTSTDNAEEENQNTPLLSDEETTLIRVLVEDASHLSSFVFRTSSDHPL